MMNKVEEYIKQLRLLGRTQEEAEWIVNNIGIPTEAEFCLPLEELINAFEEAEKAAYNFGAIASGIDLRDYRIKPDTINNTSFELYDLPPVKNQRYVNSCVAHSSSSILEWLNSKETNEYHELSVGFIYGMQGVAFNKMGSGMRLRDVCKIVQRYGNCLHATIPFNLEMPICYKRLIEKLNDSIYHEASTYQIKSYARCMTKNAVKYALIKYGPVLLSARWYKDYSLNDDYVINFDTASEKGCHAIMVYGFNEKGWLCQNSWGSEWGNNGRFILPYTNGFREAWSFVDAQNDDIYKPYRNTLFDMIYKAINYIINLFIND